MEELTRLVQLTIAISVAYVWVFRFHNVVDEFKKFELSDLTRNFVGVSKISIATLLVVGGALLLVFLTISTYLCVRRKTTSPKPKSPKSSTESNGLPQAPRGILINKNNENMTRTSMTTHIPLQRGIDDCIADELESSSEKNPDIIPVPRNGKHDQRIGVGGYSKCLPDYI